LVQISLGKDHMTGKYKNTTRRGFKTKKEAEAAAREILIRHSNGLFLSRHNITFGEVYKEWIVSEGKRLKQSTLTSKTAKFKNVNVNIRMYTFACLIMCKITCLLSQSDPSNGKIRLQS
ncbi:MAG TPA: Arm DNA-binding domain-containing protein, partial [Candidatus Paenibacillus intestinavium]|nr:Arm DNA-binding domain-containing protein [Candidatus Paenibacillus intestinavium]